MRGDDPRELVPRPGRPVEDRAVGLAGLDRGAQRRAGGEQVLLPHELVEIARSLPHGQRRLVERDARALPRRLSRVEEPLHVNGV